MRYACYERSQAQVSDVALGPERALTMVSEVHRHAAAGAARAIGMSRLRLQCTYVCMSRATVQKTESILECVVVAFLAAPLLVSLGHL